MNSQFKNKDEYLAFVTAWKANYADLSVAIRTIKRTTRKEQSMRALKKLMKHCTGQDAAGHYLFDNAHIQKQFDDLIAARVPAYGVAARVTIDLDENLRGITEKKLATKMLEARAAGKVRANANYLALKAATVEEEVQVKTEVHLTTGNA